MPIHDDDVLLRHIWIVERCIGCHFLILWDGMLPWWCYLDVLWGCRLHHYHDGCCCCCCWRHHHFDCVEVMGQSFCFVCRESWCGKSRIDCCCMGGDIGWEWCLDGDWMHLQTMQSVMRRRRRDDVPAFGVGRRMMMVIAGTLAEGEENGGGGGGGVHLYSLLLPLLSLHSVTEDKR